MSEFDNVVQRQRELLEAEEWAKGIHTLQIHRLYSMYYETADSKQFLDKGHVTDTTYNNGVTIREQKGKVVYKFGEELKGQELVDAWKRNT
tara:strand:+ start:575 stop:847 length:273 start_codon:yes stop_codon:yes gene_type:complete